MHYIVCVCVYVCVCVWLVGNSFLCTHAQRYSAQLQCIMPTFNSALFWLFSLASCSLCMSWFSLSCWAWFSLWVRVLFSSMVCSRFDCSMVKAESALPYCRAGEEVPLSPSAAARDAWSPLLWLQSETA